MIKKSGLAVFLLFALGWGLASTSHAALYQLDIEAQIRDVSVSNGGDIPPGAQAILAEFGLSVGATIGARYLLDGDSPANITTELGITRYSYDAVVSGSVLFPTGYASAFDPALSSYGLQVSQEFSSFSEVTLAARGTADSVAGALNFRASAQLFDEEGLALIDTALDPSVFLDLSLWDSYDEGPITGFFLTFSTLDFGPIRISAEYTNTGLRVVPLPGAAWLLASSLLVGSAVGRERKRPTQSRQ